MMVTEQQPADSQNPEPSTGLTAAPTDAAAERQRLLAEMAQLQAQLQSTASDGADEPFTRSTWAGRELFTCNYCPDTSFSEQGIRDHLDDDAKREIHRAHPDFPG